MRSLIFAFLVAIASHTSPVLGQEAAPDAPQSVKPGINKAFLDPDLDVEKWIKRFEVESREVFRARTQIVKQLKLSPGDRIADIGTGTGLFVEPFSEAVGNKGWVYALDIAPKFVERVGKMAEILHLNNVTPVLSGQDDIRLAPGSVDVAFICDVYHHFEYPAASLASIRKALVPGGTLVLIDFERIPGKSREWTLNHVRAGKATFRKEIEKAGFEFVEEAKVPALNENYFLRFRRK
ncbi:MAG: methyltransferase [Planctomycetes bacterium]|nr:methyltransferase [Planctomycetota bacterium]MCH9725700.1 methyltransferase [Planctomycetota bacterium]MCH9777755.1 methyltransferase [Planctomycetota bacterium]MCH9791207.1 methyltransferase [Planctomycetota bacterium]MDF1745049.1 methyltransferase [Gimesia sp.]